jgi:hypothetical protein
VAIKNAIKKMQQQNIIQTEEDKLKWRLSLTDKQRLSNALRMLKTIKFLQSFHSIKKTNEPIDVELLNIWKTFSNHNLRYIMIGGLASVFYGSTSGLQELKADVWIEDTLKNRKALRAAINELKIGDFEQLETLEFITEFTTIYVNQFITLDLYTDLKFHTKKDFDDCYQMSRVANIDGIKIPFLHINQLIQEKKANNRPKDLLDIEELEKIQKLFLNK